MTLSNFKMLHRFWFKFTNLEPYDSLQLGCGVTAYNYEDAVALLKLNLFLEREPLPVESVIEDVKIEALDQKHVVPNMEPPVWRGIWFPKGYTIPK